MAKRKTPKVKDLKVKADKITAEELKELQVLVRSVDHSHTQLGRLESSKHTILHSLAIVQDKIKLMQSNLEEKYGDIDIDVRDGSIKEKDGQANS
jgi:hypothetical protein